MINDFIDLASSKVCDERRKYKSCNCIRGKKNPCQYTAELIEKAEKYSDLSVAEKQFWLNHFISWTNARRCPKSKRSTNCGCSLCWKAEKVLKKLLMEQFQVSKMAV